MIGSAIARLSKGWQGKPAGAATEPTIKTKQMQEMGQQANTNATQMPVAASIVDERQAAELALIERCKQGDQVAFASLVEMHQDFVYNLAYRILQSHEEADDATQEAFVKIWQALPNFRGDSKFSTWLYRVVHNLCLNRLRSTKSGPQTVSVEFNWDDEGDEGEREILANMAGDPAEDPAQRFDTAERRKLIWREVDALPAKYREIITLYYAQELSYEEIAAALDVPVGTVKTHLFRAKAQLRNKLNDLNDQGVLELA
jgi:RNA polymerase sigma-70 factor (ECF subfamily)